VRRLQSFGLLLTASLLSAAVGCAGEPEITPSPEPVATSDADEAGDSDAADGDDAPVSARERRRTVDDDPRRSNDELIATLEDLIGTAATAALDEECSTVRGDTPDELTLEATGRHQLTVAVTDATGQVDAADVVAELETAGVEPIEAPNPDVTLFEGDLDDGGTISVITFGGDLSVFLVWIVADPESASFDDLTWRSCAEQQDELFPPG
jgi:hypothetical protein